ncbi:MAG TPA: nuclear transport factor 2 family protein [Limnobacter sp.]|uniref:YybH family protein n=1 Tax=Limnobacter sp. TaxID=2003368 RepID=UPI002ED8002F
MSRPKVIHSSPQDIEQAFYEALEAADLDALMDLWADDEHIVCIHPGGPRVEGYHDVRDSWKEILSAGALQIRVVPVHRVEGVMVAVHNIVEQVMMNSTRGEPHVVQVNATNVFHKGPGGWKMVMHHASPAMDVEEMAEDDLSDFEPQPTLH